MTFWKRGIVDEVERTDDVTWIGHGDGDWILEVGRLMIFGEVDRGLKIV